MEDIKARPTPSSSSSLLKRGINFNKYLVGRGLKKKVNKRRKLKRNKTIAFKTRSGKIIKFKTYGHQRNKKIHKRAR